ncbi:MAG TPA: dTMP kinase [Patescibacteria group bacterium]|nr:dTMP kinase [Patescibacteria group bacterium]
MFYVFEGIDGAGCGAQRKEVAVRLQKQGLEVYTLKYPYYGTAIGQLIHEFLHEKIDLSEEMQFLLYSSQMIYDKTEIQKARQTGVLLVDRYFTTTLCYQVLKGFPEEKALTFASLFEMPRPDVVFYLDVPAETAMERKQKEIGKEDPDRHERDLGLMKKTRARYKDLAARQVFAPWHVIDGKASIDEISNQLVQYILQKERKAQHEEISI